MRSRQALTKLEHGLARKRDDDSDYQLGGGQISDAAEWGLLLCFHLLLPLLIFAIEHGAPVKSVNAVR